MKQRFSATTLAEDLELLKKEDLPHRVRLAVMHRSDCKKIVERNIKLFNILARILALIHIESQKNPQMPKDHLRLIYMERCEDFETKEEVLGNRLIFRKYIRELILNQKKAYDMLQKKREQALVSEESINKEID